MIVLSHRGFWRSAEEKNTEVAFERTVACGFGTETDVRDRAGRLVVSHDPAGDQALDWDGLLGRFDAKGLPLAVNIKADGLSEALRTAFEGRDIDWFAFDMSGPETLRYARAGLPYFTRHSDIEPAPILYAEAAGIWLDSFGDFWFDEDTIQRHLDAGKRVCVVSCELHGRDPSRLWDRLEPLKATGSLMLCTDKPNLAQARFLS